VEPGPLIAQGRDADIFDAGPGRVLRRSRKGRSQRLEADVMRHVRGAGYPAPAVLDVSDDGVDLLMERVDGPTMLADLGRRPWRLRRHARTLAELQRRLARIDAVEGLPDGPVPGEQVVHLDLHPDNVILAAGGPTVIDWTNARAGDPASDAALTWVLLSCASIPGSGPKHWVESRLRGAFVRSFLSGVDEEAARRALPAIVEWKAADANMQPDEVRTMRAMVEQA
jgi:aminoglycoside phosphotransferase (APT) family kinase protein